MTNKKPLSEKIIKERREILTNKIFHLGNISFLIVINLLFYLMAGVYAGKDYSLPIAISFISVVDIGYSITRFLK